MDMNKELGVGTDTIKRGDEIIIRAVWENKAKPVLLYFYLALCKVRAKKFLKRNTSGGMPASHCHIQQLKGIIIHLLISAEIHSLTCKTLDILQTLKTKLSNIYETVNIEYL